MDGFLLAIFIHFLISTIPALRRPRRHQNHYYKVVVVMNCSISILICYVVV